MVVAIGLAKVFITRGMAAGSFPLPSKAAALVEVIGLDLAIGALATHGAKWEPVTASVAPVRPPHPGQFKMWMLHTTQMGGIN